MKFRLLLLTLSTALITLSTASAGTINLRSGVAKYANPVEALVERVDRGASDRFVFRIEDPTSPEDYFKYYSKGSKIVVEGNSWVSVAAGLNWYLKYEAGIHISWNNPHPEITSLKKLPKITTPVRHSTDMLVRYYMNFCTFGYSTAFWDWERWEQEIDWMALHGVNLPLTLTGTATVWRNTLLTLGYTEAQADAFIAGPAFQPWWLMANLESWGGPNPAKWYAKRAEIEQQIVERYREWGMEPVFAGYSGMIPSSTPGVKNVGTWCGFQRPGLIMPDDPKFVEVAEVYYRELEKLFGQGKYFAIDLFHEGGSTEGVDLKKAGETVHALLKKANPEAVWVIQGWQENPREAMIRDLPAGDVLCLDLFSESRPMWGDPVSPWVRENGYGRHDWVYCMLLNYGGNIGMHGKMDRVIDSWYMAREHRNGQFLRGVGATAEGIENNPVMFELIFELPWRSEKFTKEEYLKTWAEARYGYREDTKGGRYNLSAAALQQAWTLLGKTVYEMPHASTREGAPESVFCARPALRVQKVSTWGSSELHYDPADLYKALDLMLSVAENYRGNNNFEYDLVDIARQCVTDYGNTLLPKIAEAYRSQEAGSKENFAALADEFLGLILLQDSLLASRPDFMVGPWLERAWSWEAMGCGPHEFYTWNARTLITTWGDRKSANAGGLHDYAHREWEGMLRDFYYPRWAHFFDALKAGEAPDTDYYPMEEAWAKANNPYDTAPWTDPIDMARTVAARIKGQ